MRADAASRTYRQNGGRNAAPKALAVNVLPEPLLGFLELFNAGEFWESHEALEAAWRHNRSAFYHGLILLASAFVHVDRENAHGVRAQLGKAQRALSPFVPTYLGFDVAALLEHMARCRRLAEAEAQDWASRIRPPLLAPVPGLIQGDEPELIRP